MRNNTVKGLSVIVVLLFAATLVQAQDLKGSFTLPMEARWGQIAMAPGEYTFSMARGPNSPGVLQLRHNGVFVGNLLTASHDSATSSQSSLLLEQSDGMYAVRSLRIADVGVFNYNAPKTTTRQVAQRSTAIPVHASGR